MLSHTYIQGLVIAFAALCCAEAQAGWRPLPVDREKAKQQLQPQKLALVVGVNQTQARYWSPLLFAKRDATRMSNALQRDAQFDQILLRVRKQDTTRPALWKAVQSLAKRIKSPLDTVFVYVSAHGTVAYNPKTKQQERYIVTSDTGKHTAATAINVKRLVRALKATPSRRVVLMLATCYTGTPRSKSRTKAGHKGNLAKAVKPLRDKALQILSASGFAQAAYESTKLKADVYTHFFLDCLRKLKARRKGVSTIDAHTCATKPTTDFVKKHIQEIQVPGVDSRPGANRDVYLIGQSKATASGGYFWGGRKNKGVAFELRGKLAAKGAQQVHYRAAPGEYILVRPGQYTVIVRDRYGRVLRYYTITVRRHHTTYLQPEMHRDPFDSLHGRRRVIHTPQHPMVTLGYVVGGLGVASGGAGVIYGIWSGRSLAIFASGMVAGASAVVLLTALAVDFGVHRNNRKIQYLRTLRTPSYSSTATVLPPGDHASHLGQFH